MLKIILTVEYFGHLVTMWKIENFTLHVFHTGLGYYPLNKKIKIEDLQSGVSHQKSLHSI